MPSQLPSLSIPVTILAAIVVSLSLAPATAAFTQEASQETVQELNASSIFEEAYQEAVSSDKFTLLIVGGLAKSQFRLGELPAAIDSIELYYSDRVWTDGNQSYYSHSLWDWFYQNTDVEDYGRLVEFLDGVVVRLKPNQDGIVDAIDRVRANMIARSLARDKPEIAYEVLASLSQDAAFLDLNDSQQPAYHPTVIANYYFVNYYLKNRDVARAIATISEFTKESARQAILKKIDQEYSSVDPRLAALMESLPEEEQEQLDDNQFYSAIESGLVELASRELERMRQQDPDEQMGYQVAELAELLIANDRQEEARRILTAELARCDKSPEEPIGYLDLETLAEQFIAIGDDDIAIELCGPWLRADNENDPAYQAQPLYHLANDLAVKDFLRAIGIAASIEDPFWRSETCLEMLGKFQPHEIETINSLLKMAQASILEIQDEKDRSWMQARLIEDKYDKLEMNIPSLFEEVMQVEVPLCRSRPISILLAEEIDQLTDQQIERAIDIVAEGDTDSMTWIIDGLLEGDKHELAIRALSKMTSEYDWQRMAMEEVVGHLQKNELIGSLFPFVDDFPKYNRSALINQCWPSFGEQVPQRWVEKARVALAGNHQAGLYGRLLDHSLQSGDYDYTVKLLNSSHLDWEETDKINSAIKKFVASQPSAELDKLRSHAEQHEVLDAINEIYVKHLIGDRKIEEAYRLAKQMKTAAGRGKGLYWVGLALLPKD